MKRTQALIYGKSWLEDEYLDATDREFIEAAIKALEQETCEDAISRKDAILQIQRHGVGCFDPDDFIPEQAERFIINRLKELQPIQPTIGRWIPVTERLPEEHKEVLTCGLGGFIEIQSIELNCWENQHGDWSSINEVVAWMPLPEPYKAESEE